MPDAPRILVISHGHPQWSPGGGEIAAWSIFKGYKSHQATGDAFFLARKHKDVPFPQIQRIAADEYLWYQPFDNRFFMQSNDVGETADVLNGFLNTVRPDIVHVHHAWLLGYEILEIIKKFNNSIKLYFTLHEFLPICPQNGKMIKNDRRLCWQATPDECCECFPEMGAFQILQRKMQIRHYFSFVDKFIAPSNFLQNRYISWGIAPDRIYTLENGLRPVLHGAAEERTPISKIHIGFFGQLLPVKGLLLLLDALEKLEKEVADHIQVEIHGSNLHNQSQEFQDEIMEHRQRLEDQGLLKWCGEYAPDEVGAKMSRMDYIVVPSIWWENSPVVIQEAFACGCPVITADIGGMAEKVKNDVNGLHFKSNNPFSLAECITRVASETHLLERLRAGIVPPPTIEESVNEHLRLMNVINDWPDRIDGLI